MARPKKIGLDYFPLNCQMNDKVVLLEKAHGLLGFAVYIKLLQKIYKTEEGVLDMSDEKQTRLLARSLCLPSEQFLSFIETMCDIDLFDEVAYKEHMMLTSDGVKKRIGQVDALRKRKRDNTSNNQEKPSKTGLLPDKTPLPPAKSAQIENEIEIESYLENNSSSISGADAQKEETAVEETDPKSQPAEEAPPGSAAPPQAGKVQTAPRRHVALNPPSKADVIDYMALQGENDPSTEGAKFLNHHSITGWIYGKNKTPIVDWKAAVRTWLAKKQTYAASSGTSQFEKRSAQYQSFTNDSKYDKDGNRIRP